jgi:hypothetical protein
MEGVEHGEDVLRGAFGQDVVDGVENEAAVMHENFQAALDVVFDLGEGASWKDKRVSPPSPQKQISQ